MTYTLQEQYNSKNQVPGAQADSVWHRGARKVSSITIHHWGNKGQQFGTVRDFLCTNNSPTSAHYVVQDGLVACIVSPDDCAFHAGNAEGNSHSIGIECRPEATDGDYATIAELIRDLRAIYGDIPLRPHNYWFNTACPGDYDLDRLDSLARGATITPQSATITPLEEDMAITTEDVAKIASAVVSYNINQEGGRPGQINLGAMLAWYNANNDAIINGINGQVIATGGELIAALKKTAPADLATQINAAGLAAQVRDELVKLLGGAK